MQKTVEQVKFWRDPALCGLEMLRATYVTHSFSRHTHDGYAIGVIESGVEEFTYRGAVHRAPAGSIVIVHPGEVHTGHAGVPDGWAYRMLYPDVGLVQRSIAEDSARSGMEAIVPYFPNPVIHDLELAAALRRLHVAVELNDSQLERESRFLWTMHRLIHRYADSRFPRLEMAQDIRAIRLAQAYLDAHYANNISLEDLARLTNLKPLRLLRAFRNAIGLPPHAYLVQVRIQNAKILLQRGEAIVDVASDTGFTDQSHLTRHFKRLVGVTPGQYAIGCQLRRG